MILWESLVPQMVVFRLPMLHHIHAIMIPTIMGFHLQHMRRVYMNELKIQN